jgi:hypothetical protein
MPVPSGKRYAAGIAALRYTRGSCCRVATTATGTAMPWLALRG